MADIQSNISVNIDTSNALASLKALQGQISAFHQQMSKSGALAASEMSKMQNSLMNGLNRSGQFDARMKSIKTTTESFTEALEKNKMSVGQYFKYAGAATKDFGKLFGKEFDTIEKVARERVKDLQTQYIKMGRDANGAMKAISIRPLTLDLNDASTKMQIAAQKQQILNQLLKQGSTQMLNWGKNTQWAGRQLMVGFTVPLTMLGQIAGKTFMQMEEAVIKFQRVYGDFSTTTQQTKDMTTEITNLAKAYTKYGVAVSDTMSMAADAAAMGKMGAELTAQVQSATELAVLGGIDQKQALETTISLTNAFGIAADQLKNKINFLNVVENQTVTSIEDLTIAVPKAAPVIKQLGGNVEDLAFFLTAMKEGGINASEGANALKSGIASIINPTKKASDMLAGFGININGIVENNKGDVRGMVMGVAEALNSLDPLKRAQAIEQLFGKFQFARISTLFKNITDVNSQATKVAELSAQGPQAAAILAQRELKKIEESPMFKFKKALEDLKTELVPLGEQFLKMVTPIAEFVRKALEGFNNLSSGTKDVIGNIALWLGGVGPIVIMTVGLIANGIANMIKVFATFKGFLNNLGGATQDLGSQTSYMTTKQLEAAAVASSLDQVHSKLRQTFTSEATAVANLTSQLEKAVAAQRAFGWTPGAMPGAKGGRRKMATGGMVRGPGGPKDDLVPTDLSNGEAVIDAETVKKNPRIIGALFSGKKINIPGYADNNAEMFPGYTNAVALLRSDTNQALKTGVPSGNLSSEFRNLGAGINAPIVEAVGRALGATNSSQIVAMLQSDPQLREFATDIQMGVAKAIDAQGGKIDDPALGKIYQDVARKEAKKRGAVFTEATERFFTQPTTFEDTTRTRTRSNGRVMSIGRAGLFKGVASYRSKNFRPIASELGTDPTGLVKAHMSDRVFINLKEAAAKWGAELGNQAKGAVDRMVAGIKESTRQKSPSKDAYDAGANIGKGAINALKDSEKDAKAAGSQIGKAIASQAQKDAIRLAGATRTAYKNDATLQNLAIQKKQAEMMGADTALIEKEIVARRKVVAAETRNAQAADQAALAASEETVARSYNLPAGVQGPIGPNDVRKKPSLLSRMGNSKIGQKVIGAGKSFVGGGIGAGMGVGMAGMAIGMIPGMEGVGSAISMASMIPTLLPMLANPIGATVAALGALTIGIIALNNINEENKKKQVALGNATVMSTDAMIKASKDLGTVSATEARRSEQSAQISGISTEQQSQANAFLETDSGKAMIGDIKTKKESGKTDEQIATETVNNLANLVAQGVMSKEIASGVLSGMGKQTGMSSLTMSGSELDKLTSGKTTDVGASQIKNVKEQYGGLKVENIETYRGSFSNISQLMPKLREGATATANAYSQIVGQADVLNQKLKTGEITQEEYNTQMAENKKQQQEVTDLINQTKDTMGNEEWSNALMTNMEAAFGKDSPTYKTAEKLKGLGDSDFRTNMLINLDTGSMSPDVVEAFMQLQASNKNFDKNYSASVKINGQQATDDLVLKMLVGGVDGAQITAALNIVSDDPTAMDTISKFIDNANSQGIDISNIDLSDIGALDKANTAIGKIKDLLKDGPVTMEVLAKTEGFEDVKMDAAWFNGLPKNQQAWAIQYALTVKDTISGDELDKYILEKSGASALYGTSAANSITRPGDTAYRNQMLGQMAADMTQTATTENFSNNNNTTDDTTTDTTGGGNTASDKASAALSILGRKEEKINKAYDERLKALDAIQAANDKINQQKKDQLDLADALSKGDIGAAARAQQQARETAQANALQKQRDDMAAARDAQVASLKVNGMTRAQIEAWQAAQSNKDDKGTLGNWSGARGYSVGGFVKPQYFSNGGDPKGTDTIAAMLTPGEFVMKKSAVDKIGTRNMHRINNGDMPGRNSVYNYSISVNVKSDADANQIANVVLTKIESINKQGIKGDKA